MVEPDCSIPGHPEVFVLGDAAHYEHKLDAPLPGVCPVAIQMGQYTGKLIRREVARAGPRPPFTDEADARKLPSGARAPFEYWNKGQLAVIGRGHAVADIGKLHFGGFFAWLAWIFVHIFFLIGFRNRVLVLIQWAFAYLTYQRGARLIANEVEPGAPAVPPALARPAPTPESPAARHPASEARA
jgi:NADH dehydrogenase